MNGSLSPHRVALTASLVLVGVLLAANAVVFLVVRQQVRADIVDRALDSLAVGQLVAVPIAVVLTIVVLRRMRIDARMSKERSRQLLADAAHQLRTPVAAALAANQALLWDVGAYSRTDRERLLLHLQHELARSARVVDRLLELAALEQEEPVDKRPVNLVTLVMSEVERHQDLAPHLNLHVETADTPVVVNGVEALLRDALSNYLDNARRHAHSTITVSVTRQAHQATIAVADDGPGPTRPSDQLFARFTTFGTHGGSGLGLAVTRAIARSHGGDAQFRDSCFVLCLPSGLPRPAEVGADSPQQSLVRRPTVQHDRRMSHH